jgi:hypothetical protein
MKCRYSLGWQLSDSKNQAQATLRYFCADRYYKKISYMSDNSSVTPVACRRAIYAGNSLGC